MVVPIQLILFSLPVLAYLGARRRRGEPWDDLARDVGWTGSRPIF